MEAIDVTVKAFFKQYNYGKADTKDFMIHCRPSVEKYVFSKLYEHVYAMYKVKNAGLDKKYFMKKELVKDYSKEKFLKLLLLPKEYLPSEIISNRAIQVLMGVEKSNLPREKVRDLVKIYSDIQLALSDTMNTSNKLKNNERKSKIFAYLIANSNLSAPATELNLLHDYLSLQDKQHTTEQIIITNLHVHTPSNLRQA